MSFAESFTYNARSLEEEPAKKEVGIGSKTNEEEEEELVKRGLHPVPFSDTNGSGSSSGGLHGGYTRFHSVVAMDLKGRLNLWKTLFLVVDRVVFFG